MKNKIRETYNKREREKHIKRERDIFKEIETYRKREPQREIIETEREKDKLCERERDERAVRCFGVIYNKEIPHGDRLPLQSV